MFPADYATARLRFREAAARAGWRAYARAVDPRGPSGEPLWIDAAVSPHPDARRTLVISSGLHGVEGFFGAAVQLALLEAWRVDPPAVRCVLLHALNPFGFAWLRRTDDRNVDLNRNFLREGESYRGAPDGYAALDGALNPQRPPAAWDAWILTLVPALLRRGPARITRAIAVGQYTFPKGLFYGGSGPTPARLAIEAGLREWLAGSADVVHLDLHTGLGKWEEANLLVDYPPSAPQRERLIRWFGPDCVRLPEGRAPDYSARGAFGPWCVSAGLAPEYLFAYAEFGTFSGARVLSGLRRENQAHHWGAPEDPSTVTAKQTLKELFCPPDSAWRSRTVARAVELARRARAGLEASCRS